MKYPIFWDGTGKKAPPNPLIALLGTRLGSSMTGKAFHPLIYKYHGSFINLTYLPFPVLDFNWFSAFRELVIGSFM